MIKKIFPIVFLSMFLLFWLFQNIRSNKSTKKNLRIELNGKISSYKDGYRGGAFITLNYKLKIHTNAFTSCIDSIRINDSISKISGSSYFNYYKFDIKTNSYLFIDSCNCTTLKIDNF